MSITLTGALLKESLLFSFLFPSVLCIKKSVRFSFPFVGQKSTARAVRRTKELKLSGRARVRSCLRESVTLCVVDLASPVKILRCVYVLVRQPVLLSPVSKERRSDWWSKGRRWRRGWRSCRERGSCSEETH